MSKNTNNLSLDEISELFKSKKYEEIIESKYANILKNGIRKEKKGFCEDIVLLEYLCPAAYYSGYYYDYLVLIDILFSKIPLKDDFYITNNKVFYMETAMESLLYCLINGIEFGKWDNEESLLKIIDVLPYYYKANGSDNKLFNDIKNMYEIYKSGKMPHYDVCLFIPYTLNFTHYDFDLQNAPPFLNMKVEREKRGNVEGMKFTVNIQGFIKADMCWKGAKWEERQELYVATPALNLINRLLLIISENEPCEFIPRIRSEQLTSVDIQQFNGNDELYHSCYGSMFSGKFLTKWFKSGSYTEEELSKLNDVLIKTYDYPLYASLFHRVKNTINAGLYEESIMMLFSCLEATVYYWCEKLSQKHNIYERYLEFQSKKSRCSECELYKKEEKPKGIKETKLPPSIRQYPNFLMDNGIIDNVTKKKITKLIVKSQNDDLRNELMHGKIEKVTLAQVEVSQKCIQELNEIFISIYNSGDD